MVLGGESGGDEVIILVCGGRDYKDFQKVIDTLDGIVKYKNASGEVSGIVIIHGGAMGADTYAALWAKMNRFVALAYPADWKKHGKAAGPIRDQEMLDQRPDIVVAFPGGRGTADMVSRAKKAGVKVIEVRK